jgi:hypothetical protein
MKQHLKWFDNLQPEMPIPKPDKSKPYVVVGLGTKNGKPALEYMIPPKCPDAKPNKKKILRDEWEHACEHIERDGVYTRQTWAERFPTQASSCPCNFTTIGGLLEVAGLARRNALGSYGNV